MRLVYSATLTVLAVGLCAGLAAAHNGDNCAMKKALEGMPGHADQDVVTDDKASGNKEDCNVPLVYAMLLMVTGAALTLITQRLQLFRSLTHAEKSIATSSTSTSTSTSTESNQKAAAEASPAQSPSAPVAPANNSAVAVASSSSALTFSVTPVSDAPFAPNRNGRQVVMVVMGTRPEGIKVAPLILALNKQPDKFITCVCSTGQHQEMLQQVLDMFCLKVDYDLKLMTHNQTLPSLTARAMIALTDVITKVKPDVVVVQGDTTTAMVAALAAFYQKVPVAHVEAGLRTHDLYSPFPEEVNRRLIGVMSHYHFAATGASAKNLLNENVKPEEIVVTGNTVIDALYDIASRSMDQETRDLLGKVEADSKMILVTAHRRENHGEPLQDICRAIRRVVQENPQVSVIFPVHLNPNVQKVIYTELANIPQVVLVPPQPYHILVQLMKRAHLILTDSGGIQEEGTALHKPILVLRESTERPEGVEVGAAELVGTNPERVVAAINRLLNSKEAYAQMTQAPLIYGDGLASERICKVFAGSKCKEFVPCHASEIPKSV